MKRFDILNQMIAEHGFRKGAEIGTGNGKTAMEILKANPDLHLIEVAWYPVKEVLPKKHIKYDHTQAAKRLWRKRVHPFVKEGRVQVLPYMSHLASVMVKDNSLDFAFIDADHSYEHCLQDNQHWYSKVKSGGLMIGHDYSEDWPGVIKAVDSFYGKQFVHHGADRTWWIWKN